MLSEAKHLIADRELRQPRQMLRFTQHDTSVVLSEAKHDTSVVLATINRRPTKGVRGC